MSYSIMLTTSKPSTSNLDMLNSEDPMELSSDIDRRLLADEDIDLDLDLTGDQTHDRDDDYMAEDTNSMTGQTTIVEETAQEGRDLDMSYDKFSPQDVEVLSSLQDEDLSDAEYNGLDDKVDAQQKFSSASGFDGSSRLTSNTVQGQEQDSLVATDDSKHRLQSGFPNINVAEFDETLVVSNNDIEDGQDLDSVNSPHELNGNELELAKASHALELPSIEGVAEETESIWDAASQEDVSDPSLLPFILDDEAPSEDGSESQHGYNVENSERLHPVMIIYQGIEMFLFPPISQDQENSQTYFLEDETYATENIKSLLGACRVVLAESIEEDEELQITFDGLGLSISESTVDSSTVTLSQISDLYVQLQENDGVGRPAPLFLTLSTTTKFSHRFDYILETVAEGKGLSQLLPLGRKEEENQYDEVHSQQDQAEEGHTTIPQDSTFGITDQSSRQDLKIEEVMEDQNPQIVISPLKDFDLDQPQKEPRKANPIPVPNDTTEGSAIDINQTIKDPLSSQTSKNSSGAIDGQHSVGNPKEALVSNIQDKPIQSGLEDKDSISYNEIEDDPIQDSSTRSSTIQGDILEAVMNSSDASLKKVSLLAKTQNSISAYDTVENDLKNLHEAQSFSTVSLRAAGTEVENLKESESLEREPSQLAESKNLHYQEIIYTKNLYEHGHHSPVSGEPQSTQLSSLHSVEADTSGKKFTIDSNLQNIGKEQDENFDSVGRNSNIPESDRLSTDEIAAKLQIAKDVDGENAYYSNAHGKHTTYPSESVQFDENDQIFADGYDEKIDHSTLEPVAEILPSTKLPVELLADADEITYDDDEPFDVTISKNIRSSPGSLKRMRAYHEDDILNGGAPQDAKRFCSG